MDPITSTDTKATKTTLDASDEIKAETLPVQPPNDATATGNSEAENAARIAKLNEAREAIETLEARTRAAATEAQRQTDEEAKPNQWDSARKNDYAGLNAREPVGAPATDAGVTDVHERINIEQAAGYSGLRTDPTPHTHYTVAGVTAGKPTPETNAAAALVTGVRGRFTDLTEDERDEHHEADGVDEIVKRAAAKGLLS